MTRTIGLLVLTMVVWGSALAGDTAPRPTAATTRDQPVAIRLRETHTVTFSWDDWFGWVNPARCDGDGNVFFVPMHRADRSDAKKSAAAPAPPVPSEILRVSAEGKSTLIRPARAPVLAFADEVTAVHTLRTAVDPGGTLFALVWAARGNEDGRQSIVSFDETGRYRSLVRVDVNEIVASEFEVFGSGEFLVWGQRPWGGPRVAVMPPAGGRLRDVAFVPGIESAKAAAQAKLPSHVARAGDGRIYFVPEGEESIHVVGPSGRSERAFRLARVPPNWRLADLEAAGPHLAAVYSEKQNDDRGIAWITVYDARDSVRRAVYGPVAGMPVCYDRSGDEDHFTVLRDGKFLVRLSPQFQVASGTSIPSGMHRPH
jgi:hypothetical protein